MKAQHTKSGHVVTNVHYLKENVPELKTYKFLATPKPPGKTTASNSPTFRLSNAWILPRAILADSTNTFLQRKK